MLGLEIPQVDENLSAACWSAATAIDGMYVSLARFQSISIAGNSVSYMEAMSRIDISAVNTDYQQLNAILASTNQGIRDNLAPQEQFNQSLGAGHAAAKQLGEAVKHYAGMLINAENISKVMGLSDEIAQTNADLSSMNAKFGETADLQQMIYQSAQQSRSSYMDTANTVATLGNTAAGAFGSTGEVVAFSEQLNKQFALSGASAQEMQEAAKQLAQGMAGGAIQGSQLNAIFAKAPTALQSIADYMGVPISSIQEMASQGQITGEVVKNALLSAAGDTNEKFAQMPMTFGQAATEIQNGALMAFQPLLQELNNVVNSEGFQTMIGEVIEGLQTMGRLAMDVFGMMAQGAAWVQGNWQWIEPMIWGIIAAIAAWKTITVVMTLAEEGLNLSLLQNPVTWVAALIGLVVAAIASWVSSVGGIRIAWLICVNAVLTAADQLRLKLDYAWMVIKNGFASLALKFAAVKTEICNQISYLKITGLTILENFINGTIDRINNLIEATNSILGTSIKTIEHVEFASAAALEEQQQIEKRNAGLEAMEKQQYAKRQADLVGYQVDRLVAMTNTMSRDTEIKRLQMEQQNTSAGEKAAEEGTYPPYDSGAASSVDDITSNTAGMAANTSGLSGNAGDIASNTGVMAGNAGSLADNTAAIADTMELEEEDMKYLRDAAEQDIINRFTLAELKIDMNNNNTLTTKTDFDELGRALIDTTDEILRVAAEGAF